MRSGRRYGTRIVTFSWHDPVAATAHPNGQSRTEQVVAHRPVPKLCTTTVSKMFPAPDAHHAPSIQFLMVRSFPFRLRHLTVGTPGFRSSHRNHKGLGCPSFSGKLL